jgi:RNA polymerase sigma-70 factor (ECF subfamily)
MRLAEENRELALMAAEVEADKRALEMQRNARNQNMQKVLIENKKELERKELLKQKEAELEAVNKQQELELLSAAVRDLPERCRQVVTLRLLYAMSHKEIAAELRISEHTVKAQLAKGMRRCAEYFEQRGASTLRRPGTEDKP